ncbi:hypothetical protein HPP92_014795 [Vanilla planifolia]|uniref:Uncharacterized protein n=1 Tax=Vanilla planifolia TaxID=51239 RepID=A0A835QS85_VANPL|nr:hypothetical protein HPP92_014795 [Vanilla planifolia]
MRIISIIHKISLRVISRCTQTREEILPFSLSIHLSLSRNYSSIVSPTKPYHLPSPWLAFASPPPKSRCLGSSPLTSVAHLLAFLLGIMPHLPIFLAIVRTIGVITLFFTKKTLPPPLSSSCLRITSSQTLLPWFLSSHLCGSPPCLPAWDHATLANLPRYRLRTIGLTTLFLPASL